jgi:hypothetical protein
MQENPEDMYIVIREVFAISSNVIELLEKTGIAKVQKMYIQKMQKAQKIPFPYTGYLTVIGIEIPTIREGIRSAFIFC